MMSSTARRWSGASSAAAAGRNGTDASAAQHNINSPIGVRNSIATKGHSTQKGRDATAQDAPIAIGLR
jgi:hypothetical protein